MDKYRLCIDLTAKQVKHLDVVIDTLYDSLDFHGDLTDMKIPVDKLRKEIDRVLEDI